MDLKIGDEIIIKSENYTFEPKFIVTKIKGNDVWLFNRTNGGFTIAFLKACQKTGNYFPQVLEMMEE